MKNHGLFFFLLLLAACQNDPAGNSAQQAIAAPPFQVQTAGTAALAFENLRLYPILAEENFIRQNEPVRHLVELRQAIADDRFRITEKKPYGRFNDRGAVNALTVQNRSQDTVFLMAGDVVQGGKQDRVIAQDLVSPPRSIMDLSVFCVEPHRWQYQEETVEEDRHAEQDKKIFAFRGYYNVAAAGIRKELTSTRDQERIWEKVGEVTAMHQAKTPTGAYAGLEGSESFTQKRDAYLAYFQQNLPASKRVIGIVAVSGKRVLGADLFGHPDLFRKQYPALLHSYVTEALSAGSPVDFATEDIRAFEQLLLADFSGKNKNAYHYHDRLVHYFFAR